MLYEGNNFNGLIDLVSERAVSTPAKVAFTALSYEGRSDIRRQVELSCAQLHQRACAIAAVLRAQAEEGERALLLFQTGLDFVAAFMGCLYAGMIAVPVPVPRRGLGADRVAAIASHCGARFALCSGASLGVAQRQLTDPSLAWVAVDRVAENEMATQAWTPPVRNAADDVAVLQYSSGSTGEPKGVMITHGNLIHQSAMLYDRLGAGPDDCWLLWLPVYHDMGLISAVVCPLANGLHGVMMSPEAFVLRPQRWLQAISDFRANVTGAPNFAYELCARKVEDEVLAGLDLSCLRYAVSGAEPVRAATIERFSERFANCGFSPENFFAAYGLAEATLLVSGRGQAVVITGFEAEALAQGRAVSSVDGPTDGLRLVSCGTPRCDVSVHIVDPETAGVCKDGDVGEIWVASDSLGLGYWAADADQTAAFNAKLAGVDQRYLRTGDLGFFHDGELYIRGRLKDLIIIRGHNFCAPDIEQTVQACASGLVPSGGAAFGIDVNDEEHLVVLQEVERSEDGRSPAALVELANTIRGAIVAEHQVTPYAVVLLAGGLPKTSSGKVRRGECRARYLAGTLKPLLVHTQPVGDDDGDSASRALRERVETEWWLVRSLARLLAVPESKLGLDVPFKQLVTDAAVLPQLLREIQGEYGVKLAFTCFADHPTLRALAGYLQIAVAEEANGNPALGGRLSAETLAGESAEAGPGIREEAIAIVGMACRFPQSESVDRFWQNLCDGVNCVTEVPADRWNSAALYDRNPMVRGKMNTRHGGFLKDLDLFDGRFFGIQAREATRMDPAHRLMMELSWELFEDAGMVPETLSATRTGVFVGISGSDYAQLQFGDDSLSDPYAGVGSALTNAASRISHFHNLRGPALAIDTACSSSLSALHMGCGAIRSGECDNVIVGGVNVILAPTVSMSLSKAGMMAGDGRCKTFDKRADGYVRAEGAGLVMLKPLSRAQADGDTIYAVIRGTASNQDGRSSAISAPNGEAQQRVVMEACTRAGILPGELDYVEAHGTGTALGDPIEVNALGEILKIGGDPATHCAIASVKTNIGHSESAAGMASLIKTALVLHHGMIPPSLNFEEPNPLIPFDSYRIKVQQALEPLPARGRPRLAGVNSFGIGGTNVNVILEEYVAPAPAAAAPAPSIAEDAARMLVLSARSEASLKTAAQQLSHYLLDTPEACIDAVASTLSQRRGRFDHRLCVVGRSAAEIADALQSHQELNFHEDVLTGFQPANPAAVAGQDQDVAFVFSGQGSQWWAMGRTLYAREPVYRAMVDRCDAELRQYTGWSLLDVLMADEADSRLGETDYAQPAVFALQCGVAALLKSWGIVPKAVVGHSFGEVAAAHVAGALSFEDACRLIAARARLMREGRGRGRMVSVELPRDQLAARIAGFGAALSIAASNAPGTTVVSGEHAALDELLQSLAQASINAVELGLDYAFHSAQVEQAAMALAEELQDLVPSLPECALMSTVNAQWCEAERLPDAGYWARNVRDEVRFCAAIDAVAASGIRHFVEIGAHPVLAGAISRTLKAAKLKSTVLPTLVRELEDDRALRRCAAALHVNGIGLDWSVLAPEAGLVRTLPHYAWDRRRYWMDAATVDLRERMSAHPLVYSRMPVAQPTWQALLDSANHPYLAASRIRGKIQLNHGIHVELALEAAFAAGGHSQRRELVDLCFDDAELSFGDDDLPVLQARVDAEPGGRFHARIEAQTDISQGRAKAWHPLLACRVATDASSMTEPPSPLALQQLLVAQAQQLGGSEAYRRLAEIGLEYGPSVQVASEVRVEDNAVLMKLRLQTLAGDDAERFHLHPLLFEAIEQAARLVFGTAAAQASLQGMHRLRIDGSVADAAYVYAVVRDNEAAGSAGSARRCDVWVTDPEGATLVLAEGLAFVVPENAAQDQYGIPEHAADWRYAIDWLEQPLEQEAAAQPAETGGWLLLADDTGVAIELTERLEQHGQTVVLVQRGAEFERFGEHAFSVTQGSADELESVLREAFVESGLRCRGVVNLWNLDLPPNPPPGVAFEASGFAPGLLSVVSCMQAMSRVDMSRLPRFWIVTAGAQAGPDDGAERSLAQSLSWGCAKSIVMEQAEFRCSRADLSRQPQTLEIDALATEILLDRADDQLLFRGPQRLAARLVHQQAALDASAAGLGADYRWSADEAGADTLVASACRRRSPAADEVEVALAVASVVSMADGTESAQAFAGEVTRSAASDVHVGTAVLAIAPMALASHCRVLAERVLMLPDGLNAHQAVASAPAYFDAVFALRELAGVRRGDRVLLRLGADAAGLALAEVARWLGARVVIAAPRVLHERLTAVRAGLLIDEHEPSAYRAISRFSDGKGMDTLINAAPDFAASEALSALGPFGRCIDLCPADAVSRARVAARLPDNASLQLADAAALWSSRPQRARELMTEVLGQLASGGLPSLPISACEVGALIRNDGERLVALPPASEAGITPSCRDNVTYLVTGGLGGLGLHIARRLVRDGARHLVLVGRRAPSLEAMDVLAELAECGADVQTRQVDVANADAVSAMLDQIRESMPPLGGIIHAAGVLDNGLIVQMEAPQVMAVMPAKVLGAWNLHMATRDDALDFFIMFSSLASFIGSPGQSNYAAANAFLEALAEQRQRSGQPGLAVAWGPWAEAGMAADVHNLQRLAQHGMGMIPLEGGLDLLEDLILENCQGAMAALPMNWSNWSQTRGYAAQTPFFAALVPQQARARTQVGKITAAALEGKPADVQLDQVRATVLLAVCQSLMLEPDSVDLDIPLTALGLDSIMSLELKDRLEACIDVVVRTNALVSGKSVTALAEQFLADLTGADAQAPVESEPSTPEPGADAMAQIEELAPEELEQMLGELAETDPALLEAICSEADTRY